MLLAHQVLEIPADGHERLGQAGLLIPGVEGEVIDGDAGIVQTVGEFGPKQAAVGSDVLRRVVDDFVRKVRT